MEITELKKAREIFGDFFFGPEEIERIADRMSIKKDFFTDINIPDIPFSPDLLLSVCNSHILVLTVPFFKDGTPVSLVSMRSFYGVDPEKSEPCFYNQDWYLHEAFANEGMHAAGWHLVRRKVIEESRGMVPDEHSLPQSKALVLAYTFFAAYLLRSVVLWKEDFVWCSETDKNGDRIYVGRYYDPLGIAKNGFSIHRHLKISRNYGYL